MKRGLAGDERITVIPNGYANTMMLKLIPAYERVRYLINLKSGVCDGCDVVSPESVRKQ